MIELNIIKEQYARMSDIELTMFATNEADKLTMTSFHLLKDEFVKRNLDWHIIESAEIDKALSALSKQTTFEKIAANEFAESLWQFALTEKESGKIDFDIYHGLLDKGVDEKYAFMLVQSLETRSKQLKEHYDNEVAAGWIAMVAGILSIALAIVGIVSGLFILYGFVVSAGAGIRLSKSYSQKEKYETISQNIEIEKAELNKTTARKYY